jgi:hypothetical protein
MILTTPDGTWQVEDIVLQQPGGDPVPFLRVKQHGRTCTAWPNGGYCTSPAQVARIMGDDYPHLTPKEN